MGNLRDITIQQNPKLSSTFDCAAPIVYFKPHFWFLVCVPKPLVTVTPSVLEYGRDKKAVRRRAARCCIRAELHVRGKAP